MPRQVKIANVGPVTISKRRRSRNLRLSVGSSGRVLVTMPYWAPYSAGILLVAKHQQWVLQQLEKVRQSSPADDEVLMRRARRFLPARTRQLSRQHGLRYAALKVKKMSSRWGSCSAKGNISLNCYLMRLPPELIDYVIIHELAHTKFRNHSRQFWLYLEEIMPDLQRLRRQIRAYKPCSGLN